MTFDPETFQRRATYDGQQFVALNQREIEDQVRSYLCHQAGWHVGSSGVEHTDLGFNPRNVINLTFDANQIGYPKAQGERFYRDLLDRVRQMPGVESASLAAWVPMGDTQFGGNWGRRG